MFFQRERYNYSEQSKNVCVYCKHRTESALFTPGTMRCECLAQSFCHVIVPERCAPSKQRGQFGGTAPLHVLCQERVEPASSSLAKSRLKVNKAMLSEALAVLWYVVFGQQEVFSLLAKGMVGLSGPDLNGFLFFSRSISLNLCL